MKHKHYDMIVAKAANMDLVVFANSGDGEWFEMNKEEFPIISDFEFFLCLLKHKEPCLHWLNGGDVQNNISYPIMQDGWVPFCSFEHRSCEPWSVSCNFMRKESNFRIKPKKEKRWIIVDPKTSYAFNELYETKIEADKENGHIHQVIEIEVEV